METGQRYSPIADSFASRLKWISGRPPREHVTIGIILLVFGVVAFGISPWLAWFTVASGLLLLTWHTRMQGYLARPAILLRAAAGSALAQQHQRIPVS